MRGGGERGCLEGVLDAMAVIHKVPEGMCEGVCIVCVLYLYTT